MNLNEKRNRDGTISFRGVCKKFKEEEEKYMRIQEEEKSESNNSLKSNSDSEKNNLSDLNLDDDRPNLATLNLYFRHLKEKEEESLRNKDQKTINNAIIFDATNKKILNTFCPSPKELEEFLYACQITLINDDIPKQNKSFTIFDPHEFMKKNLIVKRSISIEDLNQKPIIKTKEIKHTFPLVNNNINEKEKNAEIKELSIKKTIIDEKKINDEIIINKKEESIIEKNRKKLNEFMNTKIPTIEQKNWLYNFIEKINNTDINEIIKECKENKVDKNLDIVFDLDNTCVYTFIFLYEEEINDLKKVNEMTKKKSIICFIKDNQAIYSVLLIRNGLKEFLNYVKNICTFHIYTLGIETYGLEVKNLLEKNLGVKFEGYRGRRNNESSKFLAELCLNDTKRILIFDDNTTRVWTEEYGNVISSKKFIDEECCANYDCDDTFDKNDINWFLQNYCDFSYNKINLNNNFDNNFQDWKEQSIEVMDICPFYQFKEGKDFKFNQNFMGENLESKKFQFIYMKNVIKVIYYLVNLFDFNVIDAIKLIRFNSLFGMKFNLIFMEQEQKKEAIKDIILVCGGEVVNDSELSKIKKDDKIFFVCQKQLYEANKEKIIQFLENIKEYKLINEKFILDSFYFMTNIKNNVDDEEYSLNDY